MALHAEKPAVSMTKVLEAPKPVNIRSRKADSEEWPSLVPGGGTIWGARSNEAILTPTPKVPMSLDDDFPALGEAARRAAERKADEEAREAEQKARALAKLRELEL